MVIPESQRLDGVEYTVMCPKNVTYHYSTWLAVIWVAGYAAYSYTCSKIYVLYSSRYSQEQFSLLQNVSSTPVSLWP